MSVGGDNTKAHQALLKEIQRYLDKNHIWHMKILGGTMMVRGMYYKQKKGVPDILGCYRGRMLAVEIKTGDAVLDADQEAQRREIEASGGMYILARSMEDVQWLA